MRKVRAVGKERQLSPGIVGPSPPTCDMISNKSIVYSLRMEYDMSGNKQVWSAQGKEGIR